LMTGIALSGAPFSSVFSPYLASWLIDTYNWHISYSVIGGLCFVITIASAFFIFNTGKQKVQPDEKIPRLENLNNNEGISFRKVLCTWAFWCLALIYFCFHFSLSVVQVHIVPHATDLGVSSVLAASVLTIANGTNVVGGFILGTINDRIGGRKSLMVGLAVLVIGAVLLLISNNFLLLCLFAIIFGLAWGGIGSLRPVIVAELFGLHSHGTLVGAILLVALVGGTLSPILTGYIFDVTGQYQMAFLLLIGVSAIGFILSLLLSRQTGNRYIK
jgi:MFS family permease